jgi:hypothetical protein
MGGIILRLANGGATMKTSKLQTFLAITAMVFAALTIAHVDFYVELPLPWQVVLIGSRLGVAALLSWGLTIILFHFKK